MRRHRAFHPVAPKVGASSSLFYFATRECAIWLPCKGLRYRRATARGGRQAGRRRDISPGGRSEDVNAGRMQGAADTSLQLLGVECKGCTYIRSARMICNAQAVVEMLEQTASQLLRGATYHVTCWANGESRAQAATSLTTDFSFSFHEGHLNYILVLLYRLLSESVMHCLVPWHWPRTLRDWRPTLTVDPWSKTWPGLLKARQRNTSIVVRQSIKWW